MTLCSRRFPDRREQSPDQTLHLFFYHGDTLPETHLGLADGPDRHPYAGAEGGVSKAKGYEAGGNFCRGAGEGGGSS